MVFRLDAISVRAEGVTRRNADDAFNVRSFVAMPSAILVETREWLLPRDVTVAEAGDGVSLAPAFVHTAVTPRSPDSSSSSGTSIPLWRARARIRRVRRLTCVPFSGRRLLAKVARLDARKAVAG
jgi:hypothetical protein